MKRIACLGFLVTLIIVALSIPCSAATSTETVFEDVLTSDYYCDSVLWAKDKGITGGVTATTFQPASTCTRGQVVTFLWRANGKPEPKTQVNPFKDIKPTDYFYNAVLWAVEQGITGGVTADTFAPYQQCTRAHAITFLWRAENKPTVSSKSTWADQYSGKYYCDAMKWAESYGMIWESVSSFNPNNACPRADIVTYIHYAMNPNAVVDNSSSNSWADHIDRYKYVEIVGAYDNSYKTADTALKIGSAEELAALAAFTNSRSDNDFFGKYVSLTKNIDLGAYQWEPIGQPEAKTDTSNGKTIQFYQSGGFSGKFLGNGYKISNLKNTDSNRCITGLFGAIKDATITDVSLSGAIKGSWNIGSIAAYAYNSTIKGCHSSMDITTSGFCAGGIVGQHIGGSTISNCSFSGTIKGTGSSTGNIGGIAGWCGGDINNSTCSGTIQGGMRVGGIVGRLQNSGIIENCTFGGNVRGNQQYGDIVGVNDGKNSKVINCTTGEVTAPSETPSETPAVPEGNPETPNVSEETPSHESDNNQESSGGQTNETTEPKGTFREITTKAGFEIILFEGSISDFMAEEYQKLANRMAKNYLKYPAMAKDATDKAVMIYSDSENPTDLVVSGSVLGCNSFGVYDYVHYFVHFHNRDIGNATCYVI